MSSPSSRRRRADQSGVISISTPLVYKLLSGQVLYFAVGDGVEIPIEGDCVVAGFSQPPVTFLNDLRADRNPEVPQKPDPD
jgi:hypothetical protein